MATAEGSPGAATHWATALGWDIDRAADWLAARDHRTNDHLDRHGGRFHEVKDEVVARFNEGLRIAGEKVSRTGKGLRASVNMDPGGSLMATAWVYEGYVEVWEGPYDDIFMRTKRL